MQRERGLLKRSWDVITGRTRYSADEADRFLEFMDDAVQKAFLTRPDAANDPELAASFYEAVNEAAVSLRPQRRRYGILNRRRLLIVGSAALGTGAMGIAGKTLVDYAFSPYQNPLLTRDMSSQERQVFLESHVLTTQESVRSSKDWRISYEKKDHTKIFQDYPDYPYGSWIKNFTVGETIGLYGVDSISTAIWFNEFKSADGTVLPVLEVGTANGSEIKIIGTQQAVNQGADISAVKFSHAFKDVVHYLAVRRIETSRGVVFEAKIQRRVNL